MPTWFCLLLLIPLIPYATTDQPDISLLEIAGSTKSYHSLVLFQDRQGILLDSTAAIHGNFGLHLLLDKFHPSEAGWTLPVRKSFWLRFYARLDPGEVLPQDSFVVGVFRLFEGGAGKNYSYAHYLKLFILKKPKAGFSAFFGFRNRRLPDSEDTLSETVIFTQTPLLVELKLTAHPADSVRLELFIDGRLKADRVFYYPFKGDSLELNFFRGVDQAVLRPSFSLHLDDFIVSDERPGPIPPVPAGAGLSLDTIRPGFDLNNYYRPFSQSVLHFNQTPPGVPGEIFKAARLRITRQDFPEHALFLRTTQDPSEFFNWTIPFPLDSGAYQVQLKLKNNFGQWGDFSEPFIFRVNRPRVLPARILSAYFTLVGKSEPCCTLSVGRWYDLKLQFETPFNWRHFGYAIAYLNTGENRDADPSQKGGVFCDSSQYVLNVSRSQNGDILVFERSVENSTASTKLLPGTIGRYLDLRDNAFELDTLKGHLKVRVRLLASAIPGDWFITAFLRPGFHAQDTFGLQSWYEDYSNLYQTKVVVVRSIDTRNLKYWLAGTLIFLFLSAAIIFIRKRRPQCIKADDSRFTEIHRFLEEHLAEKIVVAEVCKAVGIGENAFYTLFREKGVKFSQYLNDLRIEKAKTLLRGTSCPIVEIAKTVGYDDELYFFKIFKKSQGMTPGEFRKFQ